MRTSQFTTSRSRWRCAKRRRAGRRDLPPARRDLRQLREENRPVGHAQHENRDGADAALVSHGNYEFRIFDLNKYDSSVKPSFEARVRASGTLG